MGRQLTTNVRPRLTKTEQPRRAGVKEPLTQGEGAAGVGRGQISCRCDVCRKTVVSTSLHQKLQRLLSVLQQRVPNDNLCLRTLSDQDGFHRQVAVRENWRVGERATTSDSSHSYSRVGPPSSSIGIGREEISTGRPASLDQLLFPRLAKPLRALTVPCVICFPAAGPGIVRLIV